MRILTTICGIGLMAACLTGPSATGQPDSEWTDLLDRGLRDWSRVGDGKNPWRLTADGALVCDRGPDLLIAEREFRDGTLRFEFRFAPTEKKAGYQAALWVRRSPSGEGCKVALGDKCGSLSVATVGSSDRLRTFDIDSPRNDARPPGAWNLVKVQLQGRAVSVFINGQPAGAYDECGTSRGLIGLEAEGSAVEFRKVMWKDNK